MLSHAIFIIFVDFPDLLRIDTHFVVLVVFPFCCCNPFVVETVVQVLLTYGQWYHCKFAFPLMLLVITLFKV